MSTCLRFAYFCQVVLLNINRDRLTPISVELVTRAGSYVASDRLFFLIVWLAAAAVEQEEVLLCHRCTRRIDHAFLLLVPDAVSLFLVASASRARYGARFRTRLQHGAILLLTQHMRQTMVVLFLRDVRSRF